MLFHGIFVTGSLPRAQACGNNVCLVIPLVDVQIPKSIALALVAMRVQWREADEHLEECTADLMAVGGVLHLDILSLPAPASKTSTWTLRAVTPDTQVIHRHVTHSRTSHAVTHRHTSHSQASDPHQNIAYSDTQTYKSLTGM